MEILVSSNEWPRFKKHLAEEGISTTQGFDFLQFTEAGLIASERKRVPGDLLASAEDGRLARECTAMREEADYGFVVCEGKFTYTQDGYLRDGKRLTRWTKTGVRNLLRSIRFVEGADIEFTANTRDTAQLLRDFQKYFDNPKHGGYRSRPTLSPAWYVSTFEERYLHWIQGLPGISIGRANKIAGFFSNPMAVMSATLVDWKGVPGIGDKTAKGIWEFLHGGIDKPV